MAVSPQEIDARTFWSVLGERATGATIVTADSDDGPVGFLGLSAAHVSASPATMLVSIDHKTSAISAILSRRHFAINYLPAAATGVAEIFGGKSGVSGAARFTEGDWTTLATGAPIYREALGAFDCLVDQVVEQGQTSIVIGKVAGALARGAGAPLVFFRGKYHRNLSL